MRRRMIRSAALVVLCSSLTVPAVAAEPFEVDLHLDLPLAVGAAALGGTLQFLREELVRDRCAPDCDASAVNALDATVRGRFSGTAKTVGDVLVAASLALPHLVGGFETALGDRSALSLGEDTVLIAETLAISSGIHQITAFVSQRPRPYAYNTRLDAATLHEANTYLSFYSGHTANSFAVATAYSYIFSKRHPGSRWTPVVWTMSYGLAGLVGFTRATSGFHYWTDVLAGAVIGSSIGLVVPYLHLREDGTRRTLTLMPMLDAPGLMVGWAG